MKSVRKTKEEKRLVRKYAHKWKSFLAREQHKFDGNFIRVVKNKNVLYVHTTVGYLQITMPPDVMKVMNMVGDKVNDNHRKIGKRTLVRAF